MSELAVWGSAVLSKLIRKTPFFQFSTTVYCLHHTYRWPLEKVYGRNRKLFWWIFPSKSHDDSRQDLDSPVPIMHGKMLLISNTKNNEWRALNTYIFSYKNGVHLPRSQGRKLIDPLNPFNLLTNLHSNLDLDICILFLLKQQKKACNLFSNFHI